MVCGYLKTNNDDMNQTIQEDFEELYRMSIENPDEFWSSMASSELHWQSPWDKVMESCEDESGLRWFVNGNLNASYNCIDRHVLNGKRVQAAIIWQGESREEVRILTYGQLLYEVGRAANTLKKLGVKKGDRVSIYLPMIPELPITMLACARIGAVHNIILAGFSAEALRTRIDDSGSEILVTSDGAFRGGDLLPLKFNVDIALAGGSAVKKVLVVKRTKIPIEMIEGRDHWWHERISQSNPICDPEVMESQDPLFLLYTSGFTSIPKGVCHSTAGYLLHAVLSYKWMFDYGEGDIHWCTGDIGWVTGHSYTVYAPLCAGGTTLIYEGALKYPSADRYWEIVNKFGVNSLYTTPTTIRVLMKDGDEGPRRWDLSTLRVLGCVGEAISPSTVRWYRDVVGGGRCPVVNSWWQTETGGACLATFPQAPSGKPGSVGRPFFGVVPTIVRENTTSAEKGEVGLLALKGTGPGLLTTVYGDHDWYKTAYFSTLPGLYFTGDSAMIDENDDIWILGRVDDVIMTSGQRIGSVEIEHTLTGHGEVVDAAAVSITHPIKGEAIYCFVTLGNGSQASKELEEELVRHLHDRMGKIVTPECIHFCNDLPRTRNGKIVRSVLRKIASGDLEEIGDISGLANPKSIRDLILSRPSK